jgi:hypothetical protein
METTPLTYLNLCSTLYFDKIAELPSEIREEDEFLLIFKLNSGQSRNIEPDRDKFLGELVFTGRKTGGFQGKGEETALPEGQYLFVQCRDTEKTLNFTSERQDSSQNRWSGILDMAVEQQKDALWEKNNPGDRLYVRLLFEDGCRVTQLLRPVIA